MFAIIFPLFVWTLPWFMLAIPEVQRHACKIASTIASRAGGELTVGRVEWDLRGGFLLRDCSISQMGTLIANDLRVGSHLAWSQLYSSLWCGELPFWIDIAAHEFALEPMLLSCKPLGCGQLKLSGGQQSDSTKFELRLQLHDESRWLDLCLKTQLMGQAATIKAEVDLDSGQIEAFVALAARSSTWHAHYDRALAQLTFDGHEDAALQRSWSGLLAKDQDYYRLSLEQRDHTSELTDSLACQVKVVHDQSKLRCDWALSSDAMQIECGGELQFMVEPTLGSYELTATIREQRLPGRLQAQLTVGSDLSWRLIGDIQDIVDGTMRVTGAGQGCCGIVEYQAQIQDVAMLRRWLPHLTAGVISLEGSVLLEEQDLPQVAAQLNASGLKLITAPADLDCDYALNLSCYHGSWQIEGTAKLNSVTIVPSQLQSMRGFQLIDQDSSGRLDRYFPSITAALAIEISQDSAIVMGTQPLHLEGRYLVRSQLFDTEHSVAVHLSAPLAYVEGHAFHTIEANLHGSLDAVSDISLFATAQTELANTELLIKLEGMLHSPHLQIFSYPYLSTAELLEHMQLLEATQSSKALQQSLIQALRFLPKAHPQSIQRIKHASGLHHCEIWPISPSPWAPTLHLSLGPNLNDRILVQLYEQVNKKTNRVRGRPQRHKPAIEAL